MQQTRTVVDLIDDIDGSSQATTVSFGLDGRTFEIELGERNETRLRKALEPFIEHAREQRPKRRSRKRVDPATVRSWAVENGVEVSSHGRVPNAVVDQYRAAMNGG
ncbi:Lsr2-like DNA bridging protein [Streptomyces phage Itza]|nr:Lsr2-like DNA bridging protein [Streptomyces phage Urza]QJD50613.1 Lsr2-like DNA bridging protein [Streptomyces phage Itza]